MASVSVHSTEWTFFTGPGTPYAIGHVLWSYGRALGTRKHKSKCLAAQLLLHKAFLPKGFRIEPTMQLSLGSYPESFLE